MFGSLQMAMFECFSCNYRSKSQTVILHLQWLRSWWYRRSQGWTVGSLLLLGTGDWLRSFASESKSLQVLNLFEVLKRLQMLYGILLPWLRGKANWGWPFKTVSTTRPMFMYNVRSSLLIHLGNVSTIWRTIPFDEGSNLWIPLPSPPFPAWNPWVARYDARATCRGP